MSPFSMDHQRRQVLITLMILAALGCVVFAMVNVERGAIHLSILQILFVFYTLALLPVVWRSRDVRKWALIYLLPLFSLIIVALATPQVHTTVFVWLLLIPVTALFLLGRRLGLGVSLAFLSVALILVFNRFVFQGPSEDWLASLNLLICGAVVLVVSYVYERGREQTEEELRRLAATDPLTGIPNRVGLAQAFTNLARDARHDGSALSILMLDLDYFKQVNDRFGHEAGDDVLIRLAGVIRRQLRTADFFCRLGGEEFLVVLPHADADSAAQVAEQLRQLVANTAVAVGEQQTTLTVSIGVAELGRDGKDLGELLRVADRRLYTSKAHGRNRVTSADDSRQTFTPA